MIELCNVFHTFFVGVKESMQRKTLSPLYFASRKMVAAGARPCAPGFRLISEE